MTRAVFGGHCRYAGTTDWVAAHERILAFQYSGNPRSLMKFGDIFGLVACLRRKEMPTYTSGILENDERGFYIDYSNWPMDNLQVISTAARSVTWNFNVGLAKVSHIQYKWTRVELGVRSRPWANIMVSICLRYQDLDENQHERATDSPRGVGSGPWLH